MKFLDKLLGASDSAGALPEVATLPTATVRSTKEIVEEIHHAFNSVGDKLLADAQAVLAGTDATALAKGELLKQLGFTNTRQAKQTQEAADKAAIARKQQELIMHYAVKYPTSKFITREHVDTIAAKYNLVVGDISAYTGFVPQKNLDELAAFNSKFQNADKPVMDVIISRWSFTNQHKEQIAAITKKHPGLRFKADDPIFDNSLRRGSPYCVVNGERVWFDRTDEIDTSAQLIAAPIADMDMSKLSQVGNQWFKVSTVVYPDPVVLQPVKGGYLIATAWGDEASDLLVLNEQLN